MSGLGNGRLYRVALVVFRLVPEGLRTWLIRRVLPRFYVGTSPFVTRSDGRVLLVRHSYKSGWGTPGGFLDRREAALAGAVREVREEVGLDVEVVGEPAVVVDHGHRRVEIVVRAVPRAGCDPDTAEISSPEIIEVAWFDPADLPALQDHTAEAWLALLRAEVHRSQPPRWPAGDEG